MGRERKKAASRIDEASPAFVRISRALVGLIALLLAMIPWSERYSMLDNFPHGQDSELNLLAFFVLIGLLLLLARSCQKTLSALFALPSSILRSTLSMPRVANGGSPLTAHHIPPLPSPFLSIANLPLQI